MSGIYFGVTGWNVESCGGPLSFRKNYFPQSHERTHTTMKRPKIDFRHRKAAKAIAEKFDTNPPPDCRIGRGRITLRFRQTGAASWPESDRIEYAFRVASFVRELLAVDPRRALRRRASRAVVVIYEDMMIANGCDIDIRWACVVPASTDQRR